MESHFEHKYNREYDTIENLVDAAISYEIVKREDKDTTISYINDLYRDEYYYEPTDIKVDEDEDGIEISIPLTLRALKGILKQMDKEIQYVKSNFNQCKKAPQQSQILTVPDTVLQDLQKEKYIEDATAHPIKWLTYLQDLNIFINTFYSNEDKKWVKTVNTFSNKGKPIKINSIKNLNPSYKDNPQSEQYFKKLKSEKER